MENIEDIEQFTFEYSGTLKVEKEENEKVEENKLEDIPFGELFEFCEPFILKEMVEEMSQDKLESNQKKYGDTFIEFSLEMGERYFD